MPLVKPVSLRVLLIAILVAAPALSAGARNVSLPEGSPVLTAVLPNDWKPSDTAAGWEATSPDQDVYVSVEFAKDSGDSLREIMNANEKWMEDNNIVAEGSTTHDRDFTINGMAAHEIVYDAHDNDGPTNVSFTLLELPHGAIGVVTFWASPEERRDHADDIAEIMGSLKPIK